MTLAGAKYETMKSVVSTLVSDPETGVLIVATGSSAQFNPELAVKPVVDAVAEAPEGAAPVVAVPLPHAPESLSMLREGGITAFASVEAAAEVITLMLMARPPAPPGERMAIPARAAALLDDARPGAMDERSASAIFASLGVPQPAQVHLPPGAGPEAASNLRFPVVAKIVSPDLPHKTEAGAIALGLSGPEELPAAMERMRRSARAYRPGFRDEGTLVQEMRRGLGEALVGMTRDPLVGPMLTLGAGGVLAEVYGDVTVRPVPLTLDTAHAMIDEVRGFAPLRGYRGAPRGDLEALARLIVDVSVLMADPRVAEAELNPILIGPEGEGVVAVDALIRLEASDVAGPA